MSTLGLVVIAFVAGGVLAEIVTLASLGVLHWAAEKRDGALDTGEEA